MEKKLEIISVNISLEKGTIKKPVDSITLDNTGISGDAHSGDWHRQVSLLSKESIDSFSKISKREYLPGEFAENITLSGMRLNEAHPGDVIKGNGIEMMVTQIGKKCHGGGCAVFRESGACVMPKEGIFAKVTKGGCLQAGDTLTYIPKVISCAVITLSNRAFTGVYPDLGGPEAIKAISDFFKSKNREFHTQYHLLPDNKEMLGYLLNDLKVNGTDLIFTTGGTGIGPQDFTPEIAKGFIETEIPGIMEHIRTKYGKEIPNALLSRSVAGVTGNTFLFTLPGSVKGVKEYMAEILPLTEHMIYMRLGIDTH